MHSQELENKPSQDPAARAATRVRTTPDEFSDTPQHRGRFAFIVCVILAIHLQLCLYFIPPRSVTSGQPFAGADFQTHYAQTTTLSEGLDRFGKHWVYDPDLLAGVPIGLIFDVDNKLHFLFTYALTEIGFSRPTAFNLFVVFSAALFPFSVFFAARCFGLGGRGQIIALGLGVLIWHFDSTYRFTWCAGMISWATATHLALLIWALFYKMLAEQATRLIYPLLLLLPIALLTHVWTFAILVVPMVGLYLQQRPHLVRADHLRVWGLAAASILVNLYWLWPALRFFYLVSPSGEVGQTHPFFVFADFLEIIIDPQVTGFVMPFTLWRFIALISALWVLAAWRKNGDARFFYAALTLGWLFGLTFFAALIPGLRETEPFRFVMPLELVATVVGAVWLADSTRPSTIRSWPRPVQAVVLSLAVLLIPRAVAPVLYFIPTLRPEIRLPPLMTDPSDPIRIATEASGRSHNSPQFHSWRLLPTSDDLVELSGFIETECNDPGRILVQNWPIGEYIYWATDKPVIGGFPDRRLIHEAANIFRRPTAEAFRPPELANYLQRYNIRYLVITQPIPILERQKNELELIRHVGAHRVYRSLHDGDYFASGSGQVTAGLNRIEITGAEPRPNTQELTLRFHYMETLRCQPDCRLTRAPIPGDSAGFITVSGNPELARDFVIEHVY